MDRAVRVLDIEPYTFESENRMLKRLMAILIEILSGSHAETHYSWLFMKISQWNGIIIKNNIKWYLDQIQIITCHIQKSTWSKKSNFDKKCAPMKFSFV